MDWNTPSHLRSFKNAILHIDADAFFASCEQAVRPELKGKPVVTGKERGIASAASYPAKAAGVIRGMILSDVKKVCPDAVILPSDYETYSLFSKRMFSIMRRTSHLVEEYGIDEGFVDITGLRRPLNMSYEKIALSIKKEIERELDITVSVGLAPTKVLAKAASKWKKPAGYTAITGRDIESYLRQLPVEHVWGIGPQTAGHLHNMGCYTAYQFTRLEWEYVQKNFAKPHQEIWHELRGEKIYEVHNQEKKTYASISKTKTFTPASNDPLFIFSQLVKNLENACIKARRYDLVSKRLYCFIKTQQFRRIGIEIDLSRASAYPSDMMTPLKEAFALLFDPNQLYRSTGIVLADLKNDLQIQASLFESPLVIQKMERVYDAVDQVAKKFGKHTVHLGGSFGAQKRDQHMGERGDMAARKEHLLKGETARQRLRIPLISVRVDEKKTPI